MSCSICTEEMQLTSQPKVLQCGHTFCLPCIENWFESKCRRHRKDSLNGRSKNSVQCPVCQRCTKFPTASGLVPTGAGAKTGPSSLPTNFALLEVLDANSEELYDSSCDATSMPKTCTAHPGKRLQFVCTTCGDELVCRECLKTRHRSGHRITSLLSFVYKQRREISKQKLLNLEFQTRNIALTENNAVLQLDLMESQGNIYAKPEITRQSEHNYGTRYAPADEHVGKKTDSVYETCIISPPGQRQNRRPTLEERGPGNTPPKPSSKGNAITATETDTRKREVQQTTYRVLTRPKEKPPPVPPRRNSRSGSVNRPTSPPPPPPPACSH